MLLVLTLNLLPSFYLHGCPPETAAFPSIFLSVISLCSIFSRTLMLTLVFLFTCLCVYWWFLSPGHNLDEGRDLGCLVYRCIPGTENRDGSMAGAKKYLTHELMETCERYSKEERNDIFSTSAVTWQHYTAWSGWLRKSACSTPAPIPVSLFTPHSENHRTGSRVGSRWLIASQEL